jgi:hypothetical protein
MILSLIVRNTGERYKYRLEPSSDLIEFVEIFLTTKKSSKSGSFSGSVGQYVSLPVETISHPLSVTALYNSDLW